jgi:eukaryotic-like serine/threonine-protein kinase
VTRTRGLAGTPYARAFLTQLAPNAGLLAAAEGYGLVPAELSAVLGDSSASEAAVAPAAPA